MSGSYVRQTIDKVAGLVNRVTDLTDSDVIVGVPAESSPRSDGKITNSQLAYIHEHGSPARNIPARPFMYPGAMRVRDQAVRMMRQGALDAVLGRGGSADQTLQQVGILVRNSVVAEITDPEPPFTPLKPATIRARLRRTAAGRRQLRRLKSDKAVTDWAEDGNIHPLIDTGQLRASITWVVRKEKKTFAKRIVSALRWR